MADASSVAATFARDGYACVGVPGLEEASAAFASDFLDCAYEWFAAQLPAEHLAALPPWRSYGDLGNVLDPGWRKAHLSPGAAASARRALDGGGNAQFLHLAHRANLADGPSRSDLRLMSRLGSQRVDAV